MKNQKYAVMEDSLNGKLFIHTDGFNTFDEADARAKDLQSYYPDEHFYAIDERTAKSIVTH